MPVAAGWACIELADRLTRANAQSAQALDVLGADLIERLLDGDEIALSAREIARIADLAGELADLADLTTDAAGRLPLDEIRFTLEDVRGAAADDLANGIVAPDRALLAARMLDLARGRSALSEALATTDAYKLWGEVTVEVMLARFAGSDFVSAHALAADADIPPDRPFAQATTEEVARLAEVLARPATELPNG